MTYKPTIGLEIHTELKTRTKMFCGCVNDPDEKEPNVNICPVCTGHPGTLPTANFEAVKKVIKLGIALSGNIAPVSKFDRKNYFYPDLPKAYQISQYDQPLVLGGSLNNIRLTRIHMEEDTARLLHSSQFAGYPKDATPSSLVDYNRSGLPLMELVTEPDVKNGKEATNFAKELQRAMRYLDISSADMEKGQMRVEANISVSATDKFGTKVEVKNLNSFRAVEEAIDFEIKRQIDVLESGEKVVQETRGWDEKKKQTFSQRLKEEAHDYRYFPEPDIPPMQFNEKVIEDIRSEIGELPWTRREKLSGTFGLNAAQAEIMVDNKELGDYFFAVGEFVKEKIKTPDYQKIGNYLTSDLKGLMKDSALSALKISPRQFADLMFMLEDDTLNSSMAKNILKDMFETGKDPGDLVRERGLHEKATGEDIDLVLDEVIKENEKSAADYKKGKEAALQFLVGQAMKKLKGKGHPKELMEKLKERL